MGLVTAVLGAPSPLTFYVATNGNDYWSGASGYHRIVGLIPGPPVPNAKPVARDKFIFSPGDLQPWQQLGDVNLVLMLQTLRVWRQPSDALTRFSAWRLTNTEAGPRIPGNRICHCSGRAGLRACQ